MGSARNIKITTPADMELAEYLLTQGKSNEELGEGKKPHR
jgi:2-C-methyl-D-erythritol 4-phosphate cytidylyltransferase